MDSSYFKDMPDGYDRRTYVKKPSSPNSGKQQNSTI